MAAAVHVSGSVKYRICSQFESAGIILNALGNLPLRYFDRTYSKREKHLIHQPVVAQSYLKISTAKGK